MKIADSAENFNILSEYSNQNRLFFYNTQDRKIVILKGASVPKGFEELSFHDIINFTKKLDIGKIEQLKLNPSKVNLIALSLENMANSTEEKYFSGLGKVLKIFNIIINGFSGRGFQTTMSAARKVAEDLRYQINITNMVQRPLEKVEEVQSAKIQSPLAKKTFDDNWNESINPLSNYGGRSKIPDQLIEKVLSQAKNSCLSLFDQKIGWMALDNKHILIDKDKENLILIDPGKWTTIKDSKERALQLLLGSMEIVGWFIKSSTLREGNQKDLDKENKIIFPKDFFEKKIDLGQIFSMYGPIEYKSELENIKTKIENAKNDDEIKAILADYFDQVIVEFKK